VTKFSSQVPNNLEIPSIFKFSFSEVINAVDFLDTHSLKVKQASIPVPVSEQWPTKLSHMSSRLGLAALMNQR
jgi:hypothetical protein